MNHVSKALKAAVKHHQAGELQRAEDLYRDVLAMDARQPDAWHLLGVILYQTGHKESGLKHIREAIRLKPDFPEAYFNLGNMLRDGGELPRAAEAYRRSVELQPKNAEAHYNLACTLTDLDQRDLAVESFQQAIRHRPNYVKALNNLGNVLKDQGKLFEAIASFRRALELKPDYAEGYFNLGNTLNNQGKQHEAIASFRQAVGLKPNYAEVHNNLGVALMALGRLEEAIKSLRQALELNPGYAEAHNNLGNVFKAQGRLDEAIASHIRATELKPDYAEAHSNLGIALQEHGRMDKAIECYRKALELNPDRAEFFNNLGSALQDQDQAVVAYRRALKLKPDFAEAQSNLLMALQYQEGTTLAGLAAAHAEYDQLHAAPLRSKWRPHENDRNPERRLRLGLVSPSFGRHPVGYFSIRALENLDRGDCEIICYSDRIIKDDLTARFQGAATIWRDANGLNDEKLAEQIRADQIDILFDLAGHTARNRLPVFSRKPAPVQVKWVGYAGATWLRAMDYILADRFEIPEGAEKYYVEKVLRMPDSYVCYDPPDYAPPVSPLPALQHGAVTFSSFNNPAKITSQLIKMWASVLKRVPESRLALKYRGMNDAAVAERLTENFTRHGINPKRIDFFGRSPHPELLAEYNRIDVALDTFPYNGGLTTCEALWMGVPVVTCPGDTFASRHSLTHLSNIGLTVTIATTLDEYVETAVSLAKDYRRLSTIRSGLRERMAKSPLCDGRRFSKNLMRLLRDVWQDWCAKQSTPIV